MRGLLATAAIVLAAATGTMQLQSTDFRDGGMIPTWAMAADCGGQNRSPALTWSAVPKGTKSFALIVRDPDAPIPGGFYHWVVYNVPAASRGLAAGARLAADQLGETSVGKAGYHGPCPPRGPAHHYVFTLYALDVAHIAADAALSATQLETRMAGHVLTHAALHGVKSRS
jgi:Raf kinase inhibitor-like YbhB/YbcL family protein